MKIVAIANQKGGVGKTTTAVTLAAGAALRGIQTLLIDLDTQGNVADSLGMEEGGELAQWLGDGDPLVGLRTHPRKHLSIIRSDKTTAGLKMRLAAVDFREQVLVKALRGKTRILRSAQNDKCGGEYFDDLVIIDCAPSVDVLHTAALVAADGLIIPTRLDQFAIKGVLEMIRSLTAVKEATNSRCELIGILPTFYDRVTNESHEQLKHLASAFKGLIWPPISQDVNCRISNRMGATLWEMKRSKAAEGYERALERLIKWMK